MPSRVIKPKREGSPGSNWQSMEERAPSVLREQGPTFPRYVAVFSLMLITLGGAALLFKAMDKSYLIPPGWGFFLLSMGVFGLVYHAFNEKDFQFRRLYMGLGFVLLAAAVFLRFAPVTESKKVGDGFLPYGGLCMLLSLGYLLSFIKNETDIGLRTIVLNVVGITALANALAGFIGGGLLGPKTCEDFLMPSGVIHLVLGLLFAVGYVGMEGISSTRGYWAGRGIGILGAAMFLVALGRSVWPWLALQFHLSQPPAFFLPSGLTLMYIGCEYLVIYLGICSDNKLVVLTRRELGAFFYSPIAYIVLIGMAVAGWVNFMMFALDMFSAAERGGRAMPEPIFFNFILTFFSVIPLIFLVPIITMRSLSEEKRSGTLEVLLTAPVNEWHVVLAKFLAGLRIFMLCWYLWGLFFVALRIESGQSFDSRPIITFLIALFCMGAGFVAMGVFFSSVTKHQILAAILTFVVMLALTALYMVKRYYEDIQWLSTVTTYVSYLDLWITSARATITPRLLVLHLSVAAFWLYLSIKVLEARKWS